ncbi:MAG: hypothetical protein U5Q44_07680 [Dehalococcoidia bacterium]|nr:hypothetical protein [Dehalococcoidia bacterium]
MLTARYDAGEIASEFNLEPGQLDAKLQELRQKLFEARNARVRPGLDDKVLASWNGLALAAFAEAGRVFRDDRYLAIANRNATFLRDTFWNDGRLLHSWKDGEARIQGMLEDYAYVGLGLIELYKATGNVEWLEWARELHQVILDDFRDETNGAFFETPRSGERLLFDQKSYFDAATPSGNGAAAMLSWWLGRYYDNPGWEGMVSEGGSPGGAAAPARSALRIRCHLAGHRAHLFPAPGAGHRRRFRVPPVARRSCGGPLHPLAGHRPRRRGCAAAAVRRSGVRARRPGLPVRRHGMPAPRHRSRGARPAA